MERYIVWESNPLTRVEIYGTCLQSAFKPVHDDTFTQLSRLMDIAEQSLASEQDNPGDWIKQDKDIYAWIVRLSEAR